MAAARSAAVGSDGEQGERIQRFIQDRTPDQLKLAYALSTRQAVSELIEAVYDVRLTVRNMGSCLNIGVQRRDGHWRKLTNSRPKRFRNRWTRKIQRSLRKRGEPALEFVG